MENCKLLTLTKHSKLFIRLSVHLDVTTFDSFPVKLSGNVFIFHGRMNHYQFQRLSTGVMGA